MIVMEIRDKNSTLTTVQMTLKCCSQYLKQCLGIFRMRNNLLKFLTKITKWKFSKNRNKNIILATNKKRKEITTNTNYLFSKVFFFKQLNLKERGWQRMRNYDKIKYFSDHNRNKDTFFYLISRVVYEVVYAIMTS